MSIQGIGSSNFFRGVPATNQVAAQGGGADGDGDTDGSANATAAPSMSRSGQFLSKLQSLEQSDPAQAKQMLTDLATKLRSEASQPGGGSRKAQLAETVQKAADTGDLSELLKSAKGGGGWSRGAAAYSQTMAVTRASM